MPPMCSNETSATKSVRNGRTELRELIQMALEQCEKPCKIPNYNFSPLITNDIDENIAESYFYVSLISNKIIVKEHLLVFDTNTIIGTIGGALGLFVGFSFLSCIKNLFDLCPKSFL